MAGRRGEKMSRKLLVFGFLCAGLVFQACGKKTGLGDIQYPIGLSGINIHAGTGGGNRSMSVEDILKKAQGTLKKNLGKLQKRKYEEIYKELENLEVRVKVLAKEKGWIDDMNEEFGGDTVYLSDDALKVDCASQLRDLDRNTIIEGLGKNYHEHYFELRLIVGKLQALYEIVRYKVGYLDEEEMVEKVAKSLVFFVAGKKNGVSYTAPSTQVYTVFTTQEDDFYDKIMQAPAGVEDAIRTGAQDLGWSVEDSYDSSSGIFVSIIDAYKEQHGCVTH